MYDRGRVLPYWLMFTFFAAGSLLSPPGQLGEQRRISPILLFGGLLVFLMIGTRYDVGGDWRSYGYLFRYLGHVSLSRALELGDPGFHFLNWSVHQLDGGIAWVNVACAAIFVWGLFRLAASQPSPALAILVAVPYLIIVVSMGYTRQSAAIGILMAGLASIQRGSTVLRFAVYVAVAALFHKTAVVVLPLVLFAGKRNRLLNFIAGVAMTILFYDLFLAAATDAFLKAYVEARYSSQGAWIRVILVVIPAATLLLKRRRLGFTEQEEKVWRYFAYASLALPIILLATPSSTAVDRMALYLMPLQVVVLSRVYLLFKSPKAGIAAVAALAFAIQFTWLNYAQHAQFWLPYRSTLLEDENDRRIGKNGRR